jgi:putative restriction endonuclease
MFQGERIPLVNPQRGIFKPHRMRYLLSIKTVFPRPGGKVWYDDQREVHRQIFEGDETIDYAFLGQNPDAADNRWLHDAFEDQVPVIYFLGIAPGRYQAVLPAFISEWDGRTLKARVVFGMPDQSNLAPPENALEWRYALCGQAATSPSINSGGGYQRLQRTLRPVGPAGTTVVGRGAHHHG